MGLDDDINEIMKEVDITEIFKSMKKGGKGAAEKNAMIKDLVDKIEARAEEIQNAKEEEVFEAPVDEFTGAIDLNNPGTVSNFKSLGLYNKDKEGNSP